MKLYGLKNCDTCRKVRKALTAAGIDHEFFDLRADPPTEKQIGTWLVAVGADKLINRRGTTWRGLSEADKTRADSGPAALLVDYPALIKRPVIVEGDQVMVGWSSDNQTALGLEQGVNAGMAGFSNR